MPQKQVKEFVQNKRLAIVGVSRSGQKFGNIAFKELKTRGYDVFAVHPEVQEIAGEKCYPNLSALKGQIDGVVVCVPPSQGMQVLQEAANCGMNQVWIQQQADSPELLAAGEKLGLNIVSGKCILMYAPPVKSFHAWHKGFMQLIGKY